MRGAPPVSPLPERPDLDLSDPPLSDAAYTGLTPADPADAAALAQAPRSSPDGTVPQRPRRERPLLGGRYELVGELGRGHGRQTFRAHDRVLDRDVVVKIMSVGDARDAGQRAHVLAEARAAGRVVHPNVATVLDVAEDGDVMYMVCELAEGRPLPAVLRERGGSRPPRPSRSPVRSPTRWRPSTSKSSCTAPSRRTASS